MTNVMKKAWEIARAGQQKFGGRIKSYFSEALRLAWAIIKGEITLRPSKETVFALVEKKEAAVATYRELEAIKAKSPSYEIGMKTEAAMWHASNLTKELKEVMALFSLEERTAMSVEYKQIKATR